MTSLLPPGLEVDFPVFPPVEPDEKYQYHPLYLKYLDMQKELDEIDSQPSPNVTLKNKLILDSLDACYKLTMLKSTAGSFIMSEILPNATGELLARYPSAAKPMDANFPPLPPVTRVTARASAPKWKRKNSLNGKLETVDSDIMEVEPGPPSADPMTDLTLSDTNGANIAAADNRVSRSPTSDAEVIAAPLVTVPVPDPAILPIYLRCTESSESVLGELNVRFPCAFLSRRLSESVEITPCTEDDKIAIMLFLSERGAGFYEGRRELFKVVIKGLPTETAICDLNEELIKLGHVPSKIIQLTGKKTKRPLGIFRLETPRQPNSNKLLKITNLLGLAVRTEPFRGIKRGPLQCYNCNWFHHSSAQCHAAARCLRCGEAHATRDCVLPRLDVPKCINCLSSGHVACSRKCTLFPKLQRKPSRKKAPSGTRKSKVKLNNRNARPNHLNPPVKSQPDRLKSPNLYNSPSVFSKQSHNDFAIFELLKELTSIFSGENGIRGLIQLLQTKTSALDKFQVLLDFFAGDAARADAPPTSQPEAAKE